MATNTEGRVGGKKMRAKVYYNRDLIDAYTHVKSSQRRLGAVSGPVPAAAGSRRDDAIFGMAGIFRLRCQNLRAERQLH